jgi:DNA repair exonuclease SbcCD nuclease subunit
MRIIHLADSHLGYSAYSKLSQAGVNQREEDVYNAFDQIIDFSLNPPDGIRPDFVIHAGDLFDSVRPPNRAIAFALTRMLKLSEQGIKVILISGNHETPRLNQTEHIFKIFENLKGVYPIYAEKASQLEFFEQNIPLFLCSIPHFRNQKNFLDQLFSIEPDKRKVSILLVHAGIEGMNEFRFGGASERILPAEYLTRNWDYMAFGHLHRHVELNEIACYPGAIERLSFKEADQKPGFIVLDITGKKKIRRKFVHLKTRPMEIWELGYPGMSAENLMSSLKRKLKNAENKIVRADLKGIERDSYSCLDFNLIQTLSSNCLHFELRPAFLKEKRIEVPSVRITSIESELDGFIDSQELGKEIKIELRKVVHNYLSEVFE